MRSAFFNILRVAVAIGLVAWLTGTGRLNPELLWLAPRKEFYLAAVVLVAASLWLVNLRWTLLLRSQGLHATQWETLRLTLIGTFFSFALPSSVGGDAIKALILAKDNKGHRVTVVMSVFMDRVLGLLAMLILATVAMLMNTEVVLAKTELRIIFVGTVAALVGLVAFLGFSAAVDLDRRLAEQPWVRRVTGAHLLLRGYNSIRVYSRSRGTVGVALALSLLSQVSSVVFFAVIGEALVEAQLPWFVFFAAAPIGFVAMSLPVAPAGIGVGQVVFIWLFDAFSGRHTELGQTAVTAQQIVLFLFGLIGAYYYARVKSFEMKKVV